MDTSTPKSMELIWPDLVRRFRSPCTSVTFYAYLFVGVILCGGSGVLVTIIRSGWSIEGISVALLGYFPALVGAAVLDFNQEPQPYLRSFGLIGGGLFLTVLIFSTISGQGWQFLWCLFGTILSIGFWWVANGQNKRFDDVKPGSATGGSVSIPLLESEDKEWKK